MQLYKLMDGLFPSSYAAKFTVVAVLSAALPVLGVAAFGLVWRNASVFGATDFLVLAGLCLLAGCFNILCVKALLRPLGAVRDTLRSIHRERVYKPLPNRFRDELGSAMQLSNRLAEDLGARLHGDVVAVTIDPLTGAILPDAFEDAMQDTGAGAVLVLLLPDYHNLSADPGLDITDRALSAIGRVLIRATRQGDLICRYRDGAFCVYLNGAGREVARHVADRIRTGVQAAAAEALPDVVIHAGLAVRALDEPVQTIWERTVQAIKDAMPDANERVIIVSQTG